jgi:hypothetical protein
MFLILAVGLAVGLSSLGQLHASNTAGCVVNGSGTLVNCSMSDYSFNQQNNSMVRASEVYTMSSWILWLVAAVVVLFALLLFLGVGR